MRTPVVGTRATERGASGAGQRARLLDAIVVVAASRGYANARMADLVDHAGVSRATFYELFRDKEHCFLAAHGALAERLLADTGKAVAQGDPQSAVDRVFAAVIEFAGRDPLAFTFLTHEAMLAGLVVMDERDRLIDGLLALVERAHEQAPTEASLPDVPVRALIGGLIRLLGIRLRRGPHNSERLRQDLIRWIDCYRVSERHSRDAGPTVSPGVLERSERSTPRVIAPQPLPKGRHRLPRTVVEGIQRQRLLHATAAAIHANGYAATTVADIVLAAGVSREAFYSHFRNRPEAFIETHRLVFEQLMALTAGAFFSCTGSWPERVWGSGRAFARFIVDAPSLAHFGFTESYAPGPELAQRTDDALLAFTVFLADGYSYRPAANELPRVISEAIAATIMDAAAFYIRRGRSDELIALLPRMSYVVLAPFMGTEAAHAFLDGKARTDAA